MLNSSHVVQCSFEKYLLVHFAELVSEDLAGHVVRVEVALVDCLARGQVLRDWHFLNRLRARLLEAVGHVLQELRLVGRLRNKRSLNIQELLGRSRILLCSHEIPSPDVILLLLCLALIIQIHIKQLIRRHLVG